MYLVSEDASTCKVASYLIIVECLMWETSFGGATYVLQKLSRRSPGETSFK